MTVVLEPFADRAAGGHAAAVAADGARQIDLHFLAARVRGRSGSPRRCRLRSGPSSPGTASCRPPLRWPRAPPRTAARRRRSAGRVRGAGRRVVEAAPHLGRGREGDREVAAAVAVGRAGARQPEDRARGQALQIARVERRVGGDHDHARAVRSRVHRRAGRTRARGRGAAAAAAEDRHAGDRQVAAEVGLREHADRVAAAARAGSLRDEVPMPPFQP